MFQKLFKTPSPIEILMSHAHCENSTLINVKQKKKNYEEKQ